MVRSASSKSLSMSGMPPETFGPERRPAPPDPLAGRLLAELLVAGEGLCCAEMNGKLTERENSTTSAVEKIFFTTNLEDCKIISVLSSIRMSSGQRNRLLNTSQCQTARQGFVLFGVTNDHGCGACSATRRLISLQAFTAEAQSTPSNAEC